MRQAISNDSLQGMTLKIAVKQLPTPAYLNSTFEPDRWSFRLLDMLSLVYGFTPEYVVARPAAGGILSPTTGEWTGLTGLLEREEVDMTGSLLAITSERVQLVSFGEGVGYTQIGLMMQKPKAETRDDSLLAPFDFTVWILILVSMLVMGPLIWAIIRFRVWLAPSDKHLNRIIPFVSCVWFVYGGLMKQGSPITPITDSSRVLFATWWIFITVVTAFYTANLTAYMTFSTLRIPIRNVEELSSSQASWMAPAGDNVQMYINKTAMLRKMLYEGRGTYISEYETPDQIINRVRNKGFVYIDEVPRLNAMMMHDYHASNKTCNLLVVPLKDSSLILALAAPQNSHIHQVIDPFVHWVVMSGIAKKWMDDAAVNSEPCTTTQGIQSTKLNNSELRMIYYCMLVVYGCAAGVFVLELGLAWLVRRYRRQRAPSLSRSRHADLSPGHGETLAALRSVLHTPVPGKRAAQPAAAAAATWTSSFVGAQKGINQWERSPKPAAKSPRKEAAEGGVRSDAEVLKLMRASIKSVNGRPYLLLNTGAGVRPVPVTEEKNDVLESIFARLKRQPRDERPDG